MELAPNY